MTRDGVTINELSKMANVTVRTIRFYTDEGVLDEPAGRDRYARYTRRHFLQLNTARALKERFYPLRVIRDKMASMSDSELEQLGGPVPAHIEARFTEAQSVLSEPPRIEMRSAALLAEISQPLLQHNIAPMTYRQEPDVILNQYQQLIENTDLYTAPIEPQAPRSPQVLGEVWHRISVAPGIELHVREDALVESAGEIRRVKASFRKRS